MLHLDLFSGIGGFAYAADQVWPGIEHIFCDNEPFAVQVLKKHWPESYIYDDIRKIDTDTIHKGLERVKQDQASGHRGQSGGKRQDEAPRPFILTGGFPCQPFSAAGLRRGTADERHLWPEMLRVIRLTQPEWVIAENVRGLTTWNDGLVFEQVCTDLEACGYEVQPVIIPAVAVNAPHRRDRVWFIAHATRAADGGTPRQHGGSAQEERLSERDEVGQFGKSGQIRDVTDPRRQYGRQGSSQNPQWQATQRSAAAEDAERSGRFDWTANWPEVAAELCGMAYGFSARLDGRMTPAKHRASRLKALGNAIVPAVAVEIMEAIKLTKER